MFAGAAGGFLLVAFRWCSLFQYRLCSPVLVLVSIPVPVRIPCASVSPYVRAPMPQVHYREVRNMEYDMPLLDVLTNYRSDQSTESGTMDIQFYYDHLKPWVPLPANSAFNNATNLLNAGTEKAVNAVNFTKAVGIVDTLSGTVVREFAGEIKDGTTVCFDRYAEDTVIEFEAMIDVGPMHVDVDPVTVLWHTSSAPGATQVVAHVMADGAGW